MLRTISAVAILAVLACGAHAAEDDGIMGYWEGKYISKDREAMPIAMELIARGAVRWQINLIDGNEKTRIPGTLEVNKTEEGPDTKKAAKYTLKGEADLGEARGGKHELSGAIVDGVLKGKLSSGKQSHEFELTRVKLQSPTFGASVPAGAKVLFDGRNADGWVRVPEKWSLVEDDAMEVSSSNFMTKEEFGSFKLHLEFMNPFMPNSLGQARGNSGVYIHGCYEVQVLDSFGLPPADNDCGGIYKQAVPKVNASYPPLTWQTYDIEFIAPKFDAAGKKTQNAVITVVHNGVTIHDKLSLTEATPGGVRGHEAPTGPLMLQDHRDDVRYRNIWLQPLSE